MWGTVENFIRHPAQGRRDLGPSLSKDSKHLKELPVRIFTNQNVRVKIPVLPLDLPALLAEAVLTPGKDGGWILKVVGLPSGWQVKKDG